MKKYALMILITFAACTQKTEKYPVYEFHPLAKSYVANGVKGYLKFGYFGGKPLKDDSVLINTMGLVTDIISVSGHWSSETNYQYDSLNRMVQMQHYSDIKYTYRISYIFNSHKRILEQYWKDVGPSDTMEVWNQKYFYEASLDQPFRMIRLDDDLDTISETYYSYSKYGIEEILKVDDVSTFKTSFIYNNDSTLAKVVKEYNNSHFETDFISRKTGLIDSTVNEDEGTFYYEYF